MKTNLKISFLSVLLIVIFLSGMELSLAYEKEIKSLSSSLGESITNSGKKTVAVVDFVDLQGNVTELGRFLAEELSVALSESGKGFEVIDRTHLKTLLKEHQLAMTGLIDPKTAKKIGEIAGVHVLVTGTLTPLGDSIRLAVKALDTGTSRMIGGTRGDIAKTRAIEELLAKGVGTAPIISSQPSSPSYPIPSSSKGQKVGNVVVSVKRITVSRDQVNVILDFFNSSDNDLKLAGNLRGGTSLIDDKGNRFEYKDGISFFSPDWGLNDQKRVLENDSSVLYPKSSNDVVLNFKPANWNLKLEEIGSSFVFSINFVLYNPRSKSTSNHYVSLQDIKVQRPKY